MNGKKVAGFIIYKLIGYSLYLKYWFVHPDYRDHGIGSKLFELFLYNGSDSKQQIFWVIRSNENAIKRYKHYGFKKDNLFDFVMTNKI
jgi:ribosomal protein S18 acetylase RimI-like enzyme